jgi:uncharacterized protein (TIGR03083 family)
MPLHPAAPDDYHGLVEAYAHSLRAIVDLGRTCREEDFERPTDCPGWTVKDQISHVVGLEDWMVGGEVPDVEVPDYAHIRNETGAFLEKSVESRRGTPGEEVVDELEDVVAQRLAALRSPALDLDSEVAGSFGPGPARETLPVRILDVWTHEQDIREALGRPGNLDSPAASVVVDLLFRALPRIVARDARVEPGNAVIIDVTGPVMGRAGVRVEEVDGKRRGFPLFTGEQHEHPDVTATSIILSTQAVARRLAGRGALDDIHYTVVGDEDIARRVLEALPLTG